MQEKTKYKMKKAFVTKIPEYLLNERKKFLKLLKLVHFLKKVKNDSPESESEEELTQGTFLLFLRK